ncbi:MAG: hypothetical protein B7Z69_06140, partial [Actinobacteria bacterium 21-73-9]
MTWRSGSRPVISRSIHTSTSATLPKRCARLSSLPGVEIPVRVLRPDAVVPRVAHPGDAGVDLVAVEGRRLARGGGRALVPTGIAVAIPEGYGGLVLPRSGLASRHGVTCANAPGLIDAGYR